MNIIKAYKKYLTITAIAWAVCLVLFIVAYLILLKPQTTKKRWFERRVAERKQLYESAQRAAQEQTRIQLNEQIERLRERLGDFVTDFEDSADLTFNIGQIANKGKVTSFSVRSKEKPGSSTKPAPDSNTVDESYIDVRFVSGFRQFAAFINNLERHRPVFFVHEFKITHSNQNKSAYQVTLDVRALVRKQQETETAKVSSTQLYSVKK
jgi:hypothetical protein